MSDRRIVDYLRSRGEVTPPLDLTSSILRSTDGVSQQRRSWLAPLVPALVAAGVAAAVLVGALIGQGPEVGPAPEPTTEPHLTAEPTAEPTVAPTLTPIAAPTLAAIPTPVPSGYVAHDGLSFAILDSDAADLLFQTTDSCTNRVHGYTITFPDDWYTNTAIGETPACSWFTPEFFEVADPDQAPDEIWISINVVTGVVGYTSMTPVYFGGDVDIGGRTGHRNEFNPDPNTTPEQRVYHYVADLGSQARGPSFVASVSTTSADEYELGKAVLDRMIASLEWER